MHCDTRAIYIEKPVWPHAESTRRPDVAALVALTHPGGSHRPRPICEEAKGWILEGGRPMEWHLADHVERWVVCHQCGASWVVPAAAEELQSATAREEPRTRARMGRVQESSSDPEA